MDNTQTNTKPDLARVRKRIKDRERRFKAASPAGKRVLIAKDVLAELKAKTIVPGGQWVDDELVRPDEESRAFGARVPVEKAKTIDLRDRLMSMPTCTACAVGAVFVATVKRCNQADLSLFMQGNTWADRDGVEMGELWPAFEQLSWYLSRWFEPSQVKLMELAYERGEGGTEARTSEDRRAVQFGMKFGDRGENKTECMTAIMKNIIANKGEFKP